MQFYILGAAIFLFATSIALNVYSYSLLKRSLELMRFTLYLTERSYQRSHEAVSSFEGTD